MAKSQQRSSKETKKPKADKSPPKPISPNAVMPTRCAAGMTIVQHGGRLPATICLPTFAGCRVHFSCEASVRTIRVSGTSHQSATATNKPLASQGLNSDSAMATA